MKPSDYDFLQKFLHSRSGLVLSSEKQYLVESRLIPVARRAGLGGLDELVAKIRMAGSMELKDDVVEAMTTNETFFFRDKTPFMHFEQEMLPTMLKNRASKRRIRIWSAAASTGQEPYCIAIKLQEARAKTAGFRFEILGTDISKEVLEKARTGIYSQFEVQRGLPIQMLLRYFTQLQEIWQIAPEIRAMVQWKQLNLLENFVNLGEFDIVFCRNVLIYFDQATKIEILNRIAKQMPDDGYLVLGAAETVVGLVDSFEPVPNLRGLYRPKRATQVSVPASSLTGFTPRIRAIG
ncbi:protein-glutamate O-methyltransferase CheR [Rhodobacteraceae bacterium RKSG542]|uniref:CheR family methyltransferase n=1 Tax=Pseudovibrio flavus TaxID=2529854 RepID=UPI0012BC27D1|nr:protein-glutamate O-methyltransferase CheR [Pseudovibrio flavus]MTI16630.1 protein-glutamate O-methyltransferase CheR [Pseudovibrio flavus]